MNATTFPEFLMWWNNLTSDSDALIDNTTFEMLINLDITNMSRSMNMSIDTMTEQILSSESTRNQDSTAAAIPRDAMPLVATITVCYAIIFVAGILGNLITCIVISRNKSMHTATNYYLFNLAISDLLLLITGLPPDLFNIWYPTSYPFTDPICILHGIFSEMSANATVLTITAFTVERYIAICHPFRQHTMSKLSRAVKFILAVWLTAFILAIPQAMQFGVVAIGRGRTCTVKNNYIGHAFEVSGFVFFVGPMTAICVLYVLIGVKLKKSKLLQGAKRKPCETNRGITGQTRVIRMLIAVVAAFFLCWAPFHAQRLMAVYGTDNTTSDTFYNIYTALTYISGIMYFLSTCINPLLYNIMSYKFRDAFKLTLARQLGLGSKYQVKNHTYSALSRNNGSMRLTSTVNNYYNESARLRAHRLRCVSVSSQSTLLTTLSKNDMFAANSINRNDFQQSLMNESTCCLEPQTIQNHNGLIGNNYQRKQRHSLPITPIEMNPDRSPSIIGNIKINNDRQIPLVKSQSFTQNGYTDRFNNNNKCIQNPIPIPIHNVNGKINSNEKLKTSSTTLESLSEKLRRGTRKVFMMRPNHNGSNMIASKIIENSERKLSEQNEFSPSIDNSSGTTCTITTNSNSTPRTSWDKSTNSNGNPIPEKDFVHCFL